MDLRNEDLIRIYHAMLEGRLYEARITQLAKDRKIAAHHSGVGHEAIGAGVGYAMRLDDAVLASHRSGITLSLTVGRTTIRNSMFGEFGKAPSSGFPPVRPIPRFLRGTGLIGSSIPLAVGAAFADKLKGNDNVTLCFMGDGGSNRGDFHEGVNLAAANKLPIVFIVENNGYAISLSAEKATGIVDFADRAQGYGMPGVVVDGNDVLAVHEVVSETMSRARQGLGPSLIECKVFRWEGHVTIDPDSYRTEEYRQEFQRKCPVERIGRELVSRGILTDSQAQAMRDEVQQEVEDAIKAAQEAPAQPPDEVTEEIMYKLVYAD